MNKEKTLLTFLFSLVALTSICEQQSERVFMWEAQKNGSQLYLLGSVHAASSDMYPLDSRIRKAFQKSTDLVVEVDILSPETTKASLRIMSEGVYPPGDSLDKHVDADVLKMLKTYLSNNNYPYNDFLRFKPGMLSINLLQLELLKLGYDMQSGIDMHFLQKAKRRAMPVHSLETMEFQIDLLLNIGEESLFLEQTLASIQDLKNEFSKLITAWKTGNYKELERIVITDPLKEYPEHKVILDKLLFDRNENMAKKITEMTRHPEKIHFIIIGAAHMVGERGIINLLHKNGFTIKQTQN